MSNETKLPKKTATKTRNSKGEKRNAFYGYEEGRKKVTSFSLDPTILDKLERASHWKGFTKSQIVEACLEKFFEDKDYPPIPKENELTGKDILNAL